MAWPRRSRLLKAKVAFQRLWSSDSVSATGQANVEKLHQVVPVVQGLLQVDFYRLNTIDPANDYYNALLRFLRLVNPLRQR